MNRPLVSICIPTYNGEAYLKECLESVIHQTYINLEIILVDDKSIDNTTSIAKQYAKFDKRIQFFENKINLGLVGNWNKCLQLASGQWIKYVFQDDYLAINCIEKLIEAAKDNSIITCNRKFIFENEVNAETKKSYEINLLTLKKLFPNQKNLFIPAIQIKNLVVENIAANFIGEPTVVMFKKELIFKKGLFNAKLKQLCDLEYWVRVSSTEGLVYLSEELMTFRIHKDSTSSANISANYIYSDFVKYAYILLYKKEYEMFRKNLSFVQKNKLLLYLKTKLYETQIIAKQNKLLKIQLEEMYREMPNLNVLIKPSLLSKLTLIILKVKRKIFY